MKSIEGIKTYKKMITRCLLNKWKKNPKNRTNSKLKIFWRRWQKEN